MYLPAPRRSFEGAWIGETFATAIFGNSCVAIAAGLVANFASEIAPLKNLRGEGELCVIKSWDRRSLFVLKI